MRPFCFLASMLWKVVYKLWQLMHWWLALLWHYGRDGVSNHQRLDCLLNRLFGRRSKKTSKLLCEGNSPVVGEFPSQKASNVENFSIWWRHHEQKWWSHKNHETMKWNSRLYLNVCPFSILANSVTCIRGTVAAGGAWNKEEDKS